MDKIEELKKLKQLLEDSVINEEEFKSLKTEILNTDTGKIVQEEKKLKVYEEEKYGTFTVSYKGRWFLIDAKTTLNINGVMHSKHSTKKGFSVNIPIESDSITINVKVGGVSSTTYDLKELKKGCNYNLELIFDDTWGKYSNKFKLSENG